MAIWWALWFRVRSLLPARSGIFAGLGVVYRRVHFPMRASPVAHCVLPWCRRTYLGHSSG
jgi:hypothetical protein